MGIKSNAKFAGTVLFVGCLLSQRGIADDLPKPTASDVTATYVLQPDDEVTIRSVAVKEIADKTFRLDQSGEVNLPLVGIVRMGGNTVREAETALTIKLKQFYRDPDVELNLATVHSQPISVLGSVGNPGVYQLKGRMRLLEALSAAGGVRGDAGPTVMVTRQDAYGSIPLATARHILPGETVAEIDIKDLTEARNPAANILMEPHDVISVPAAQLVYILGSVKKSGGFPMAGRPSLTILQALALSEGLAPNAAPDRAHILRRGPNGSEEILVNVKNILAGKAEDVVVRPNDVVFVPSSMMKVVTLRTIEAAIQVGTGLAIFHQ